MAFLIFLKSLWVHLHDVHDLGVSQSRKDTPNDIGKSILKVEVLCIQRLVKCPAAFLRFVMFGQSTPISLHRMENDRYHLFVIVVYSLEV